MIISASRRTDIAAFFGEWMVNRLKAGEVYVRNPINRHSFSRISLRPDDVDCIVFWTKDPKDLLFRLPEIDAMGYCYYFLFTLTPYGSDIETDLADKRQIIKRFQKLAQKIGREKVIWRYDPIISGNRFDLRYHKKWFDHLSGQLSGYTERCIVSFVDVYKKNRKKMRERNLLTVADSQTQQYAEMLRDSLVGKNMELYACAEKTDLSQQGLKKGKCIDDFLIGKLLNKKFNKKKDPGQRPLCGCVVSRDIGSYNSCRHGCVYCYATYSVAKIADSLTMYDPESPCLCGRIAD